MKTFAAVVTMAASLSIGTMGADAAGYSTTKSNIKSLSTEQCDPKTDNNCPPSPAAKSPESANGISAPGGKFVPQSGVDAKPNASKGDVERSVAGPTTNRYVSGTITPRPASLDSKGGGTQRTGDPLPDVDVSLDRKTGGGASRAKAP